MENYVLLTGAKNNAGDYLIGYRAKKLLSTLRPDRQIIEYNRWETISDEKLEVINTSKALILTGGPALRYDMYPNIYPLRKNLNEIKVPIITMGIGYKDADGELSNIKNIKFSKETLDLLKRIDENGYQSSVRDYNSIYCLINNGINNFKMTGCPALYDNDFLNKPITNYSINKIKFSLGVSYLKNNAFKNEMQKCILSLRNFFKNADFEVLLHHSYDSSNKFQNQMVNFFKDNQIQHEDISGTEEKLINKYSECDFHIGFRVHAHIFMSSISKYSLLINEDSRGKALYDVIGGIKIDNYNFKNMTTLSKIVSKFNKSYNYTTPIENISDLIINTLSHEINNGFPKTSQIRQNIDYHYNFMNKFIQQLP